MFRDKLQSDLKTVLAFLHTRWNSTKKKRKHLSVSNVYYCSYVTNQNCNCHYQLIIYSPIYYTIFSLSDSLYHRDYAYTTRDSVSYYDLHYWGWMSHRFRICVWLTITIPTMSSVKKKKASLSINYNLKCYLPHGD